MAAGLLASQTSLFENKMGRKKFLAFGDIFLNIPQNTK